MKENKKRLTSYEEDCVWMSYRYCIGRHTIAAHCHAGAIAENTYGLMSDERMQFISEDISNEIYNRLNWCNFINMGWYGNVPKKYFKPIDVVYSILNEEGIDSLEKLSSIKSIRIEWDNKEKKFSHSIYYFKENDKDKDYGRSLSDLSDLEIWQKLANLFDKENHKYCRLIDNSIVEYFEYWDSTYIDGKLTFRKLKSPIENINSFTVCKYIPDENIKEDNI